MVISSFGRLLSVAAVVWAETHRHSALYLHFTQLLVMSSNVAAFSGLFHTHTHTHTSDILVLKLISVLVFTLFSSQNFYFI